MVVEVRLTRSLGAHDPSQRATVFAVRSPLNSLSA